MGSSFGQLFRIATWGESAGAGWCCHRRLPAKDRVMPIFAELDRRRPGQSAITTTRDRRIAVDSFRCFEGRTLGTPISIMVLNKDARPEA
jgi:chorismate synthase